MQPQEPKQVTQPTSITERTEKITKVLNKVALDTLELKTKKTRSEIWKEDQELNATLKERSGFNRGTIQYKILSKKITKRVQKLRNDKLEHEARQLNSFTAKRDLENLFKTFKDDHTAYKEIHKTNKCDPQKLKEYFEDHFTLKDHLVIPPELEQIPNYMEHLKFNSRLVTDPPSTQEIVATIKDLKNGKSSNDIPTIFIKTAIENDDFVKEIEKLYKDVWIQNYFPSKWGNSKLVALWKGPGKGSPKDPSTYRGLQIGSILCKIIITIIISLHFTTPVPKLIICGLTCHVFIICNYSC